MIHYLIDASVAVDFYRPRKSFRPRAFLRHRALKRQVTKQKLSGKATIFIPAFCVPEVFNTFDKWWLRQHSVFESQAQYKNARHQFISHVHDRKFFYACNLTRYHNLNCHEVFPVEHTTDTEFQATGLPTTASWEELNEKLHEIHRKDSVGRHYLSTFDILIIAVGMELKMIHGAEIYLLTKDARLALIASQKPQFPRPYYWPETLVSDLPGESTALALPRAPDLLATAAPLHRELPFRFPRAPTLTVQKMTRHFVCCEGPQNLTRRRLRQETTTAA